MKKIIIVLFLFCIIASTCSALSANFTISQNGSNIICTSTSTGNITKYRWSVMLNNSLVGTTGWVNDNNVSSYTFTFQDGGWVIIELCIGNATSTSCTSKSLGFISGLKDKYPPEHYKNCKLCEDAGYYWYNNSCHEEPETLPWNIEKPLMGAEKKEKEYTIYFGEYSIDIRLLIVLVFIIGLIVFGKRGRKK